MGKRGSESERPLPQWPDYGDKCWRSPRSRTEQRWTSLPILGKCVSWYIANRRIHEAEMRVYKQLAARPDRSPPANTADARDRIEFEICGFIADNCLWPSRKFCSRDPLDVLLSHGDWADIQAVFLDIGERWQVGDFPEDVQARLRAGTLGDLVDYVMKLSMCAVQRCDDPASGSSASVGGVPDDSGSDGHEGDVSE
jgi:hypothetical protein